MSQQILVIGSTNTDMVTKTKHFPRSGETVLGEQFLMSLGGKGANQAVAAARLGGRVTFVTKLGTDLFGEMARQHFQRENIATDYVLTDPNQPSGVSLIAVDARGEYNIVAAPGANGTLTAADVESAKLAFEECEVVLLQLEVPLVAVKAAAELARRQGKRIILNPAPAQPLPDALLQGLYVLTLNESEAETLTGIAIASYASRETAAQLLLAKGVENVVITLGREGAYLCNQAGSQHLLAVPAQAVDSTAAGDVFAGALAVALAEKLPLASAVTFANQAAAISVTRSGAQASAPYRRELLTIQTKPIDRRLAFV